MILFRESIGIFRQITENRSRSTYCKWDVWAFQYWAGLDRHLFHKRQWYSHSPIRICCMCFQRQVFEATSQKETEQGIESTLSLKVTSDITVFCKAVNSFGNETLAFNIKASEFLWLLPFPVLALCVYVSCLPPPSVPAPLVCATLLVIFTSNGVMCYPSLGILINVDFFPPKLCVC